MKNKWKTHSNLTPTWCCLFVKEQHSFLHATPDFLTSCDCCGLGCRVVKCTICIKDCDWKIHNNYLISVHKGYTVKFQTKELKFFALWTEPLGEVHKAKILAQSLEFFSKAWANEVIKLFIIWLPIGQVHKIERTTGEFTQFRQDKKIQKRNLQNS